MSLHQTVTPWRAEDRRLFDPDSGRADARDCPCRLRKVAIWTLALVAVGAALFFAPRLSALFPEAGRADLDYVPRDAFAVASVRVADLWNSSVLRGINDAQRREIEKEVQKHTGLLPADIERLTIVVGEYESFVTALPIPEQPKSGPSGKKAGPAGPNKEGGKKGAPTKKEGTKKKDFAKEQGPKGGTPNMAPVPLKEPPPPVVFALVQTVKPYDRRTVQASLALHGASHDMKGKHYVVAPLGNETIYLHFLHDRLFLVANYRGLLAFEKRTARGDDKGPLSEALAHIEQKRAVVLGINPPPAFKNLSRAWGLGKDAADPAPLLDLRALLLVLDVEPALKADLRLSYAEPSNAEQARDVVQNLLGGARTWLAGHEGRMKKDAFAAELHASATAALQSVTVNAREHSLQISAEWTDSQAALPFVLPKDRERPDRDTIVAINKLKQIAQAMHAYHKEHNTLPPNQIGGGLGWRVALLPYLGRKDLYDLFKLDEPYTSPHNWPLRKQIPSVYAPEPGNAPDGYTYYQVFAGPKTAFHGGKQSLSEFADGTSKTFLVVEVPTPLAWTAPDSQYNPAMPVLVGGHFASTVLAAFADGEVHSLPSTLSQQILHGYVTPSGGETVPAPRDTWPKAPSLRK